MLPMYYGTAGVQAMEQAGPPGPDGWVEIELAVETQTIAIGDLLRLGAEAEVLAPPELRNAIGEAAALLAARYAIPSS